MSAANVWSCIMTYRHDKSEEILSAYGTAAAVIAKLESYSLKDSYHGHMSGGGGDGTNSGADKNLDTAIAFLESNKPAVPISPSAKKGPNMALKNANEGKAETLNDLIRKQDNLGVLVGQLDAANADWREIKDVWGNYSAKYFAKKGKRPTK